MWQMLRARQTYFIIGYRCHNTDNTATRDKTKHGATIMVSNNKTKKQIERSLYRTDSRWTGRKIPRFETVARSAGRNSVWNRIGWIHSPWIYLTMTNGSLDYSANRDSPPWSHQSSGGFWLSIRTEWTEPISRPIEKWRRAKARVLNRSKIIRR